MDNLYPAGYLEKLQLVLCFLGKHRGFLKYIINIRFAQNVVVINVQKILVTMKQCCQLMTKK